MINGMRIFDTHTHVGVALHSGRRYTADQLLTDMDLVGVDRSLVIPFPMVEDYRAAHDEIGRAVHSHPGSAGWCGLPESVCIRIELSRRGPPLRS